MRKTTKLLAIIAVMLAITTIVLFTALPWLVARFGADYLEQNGFTTAEIEIGYPGWRGMSVHHVLLADESIELRAKNAHITYLLPDLLNGKVNSIQLEEVDVTVLPDDSPSNEPTAISFEPVFASTPFEEVHVGLIHLRVPELEFSAKGSTSLIDGVLIFTSQGLTPDVASQYRLDGKLSRDGQVELRFEDQAADGADYLSLMGRAGQNTFTLNGDFSVSGYSFDLASALAGLPSGSGALQGKLGLQIPWPISTAIGVEDLIAEASQANASWTSADEAVEFEVSLKSVRIEQGRIAATLAGHLNTRFNDYSVDVVVPVDYMVQYHAGRITGTPGFELAASNHETDLSALVSAFALQLESVPQLEFDARITGQTTYGNISGDLAAELTVNDMDRPADDLAGHITFTGELSLDEVRQPATIQAAYQLEHPLLGTSGRASVGMFEEMTFELKYDVQTGAGDLNLADSTDLKQPLAATLIPAYSQVYDVDRGLIDTTIKLNWHSLDKIGAEAALSLQDLGAHYDDYVINGLSGNVQLRNPNIANMNGWNAAPTVIRVSQIDVGFPLQGASLTLASSEGLLNIKQASATVLGGQVTTSPFDYNPATGAAEFLIELSDIDLGQVLALEGEDISGTGRLHGTLPVSIHDHEPTVQNGSVRAAPPGGVIQLSPALARPTGQPGLDFALSALQDFRYADLDAKVNYAKNGDLKLGVSLRGSNPAVEKGRAIEYNLNISENLPTLLKSLRLQDKVTERIEKQINQ